MRRWAALFVLMIVILTVVSTLSYRKGRGMHPGGEEGSKGGLLSGGDTLHLWYSDGALTDYLTNAAAAYYEETGVTVIPVLNNDAGYLENIYNTSLEGDASEIPDLYILGNDSLGKAVAAGLTYDVGTMERVNGFISGENYPETSLNAVSWNGIAQGFPLYFETTVLLYNKTYMEAACISAAEKQEAEEVGQVTAVEDEEADVTAEAITFEEAVARGFTLDKVMPRTVEGIKDFADSYDAPLGVESVFKWDVTDIFYNYYFPGSYMDVGGDAGDDPERLDIDNEKVRECMKLYQTLNQFFSIDTENVSYRDVIQEFIEGKVVMTVATSDSLGMMEDAVSRGEFTWEYDTVTIPDITDELDSRSLSVTSAVVVNGFSGRKNAAVDFAGYLVRERSDSIWEESGKIPAMKGARLPDERLEAFVEEYGYSISMPKLLGASNFWMQLEICCAKIWDGESVEELLAELQATMERLI